MFFNTIINTNKISTYITRVNTNFISTINTICTRAKFRVNTNFINYFSTY